MACAITIHKAQGSEFQVVVTPLAMQQYLLLQRNLVYTGITGGKLLVVLMGQRKGLGIAMKNNRMENGFSGLLPRLSTIMVPSTVTSATAVALMPPQAWQRP
jgi:exodeoxyribonuclease V alpha subunit